MYRSVNGHLFTNTFFVVMLICTADTTGGCWSKNKRLNIIISLYVTLFYGTVFGVYAGSKLLQFSLRPECPFVSKYFASKLFSKKSGETFLISSLWPSKLLQVTLKGWSLWEKSFFVRVGKFGIIFKLIASGRNQNEFIL